MNLPIYQMIKAKCLNATQIQCNPRAGSNKESGRVMQKGIIKRRGWVLRKRQGWRDEDRDEEVRGIVIGGVVFHRTIKVRIRTKKRDRVQTRRKKFMCSPIVPCLTQHSMLWLQCFATVQWRNMSYAWKESLAMFYISLIAKKQPHKKKYIYIFF